MPLQISQEELDRIVRRIGQHKNGLSVGGLLEELEGMSGSHDALTRRTLQRRLSRLVDEGRLVPVGEGRGRRYVVAEAVSPTNSTVTYADLRVHEGEEEGPAYGGTSTWLSPESKELRAHLGQPVTERRPVGYNAKFLASYVPNKTSYLPAGLREELAEVGRVGMSGLPAGTYVRQVLDRLLIDLSWNSSRLEGNTYSLLETERLLRLGEMVDGKKAREAQMILNHKGAIEMLADPKAEAGMNRYTLCNLHALLADNLLPEPDACGRLRTRAVEISGSVFLPLEVPSLIEDRFDEILRKADAIGDPFEQAFFCMVHLPYLQPFEDVNKRVSRIAANIPLVRANLCPLSFVDVPQDDYLGGILAVYELNRIEYLRDLFAWAYRRSAQRYSAVRESLGEPDPFRLRHRSLIGKLVRGVVEGLLHGEEADRFLDSQVTVNGDLTPAEMRKLREVVEVELKALHEGNIARYRLRPAVFADWRGGR